MPLDYKRFNGPDTSVPYKYYTKDYLKSLEDLGSTLLNSKRLRKDGRKLDEKRSAYMTCGVVSQAKGSAYVEADQTKLICSVFDPREIPHQSEFSQYGQLFCELKFAPFSCASARRAHAPDAEERALSRALKQALDPAVCVMLFPNYQVDIFVYVLQHGGSCLSAAINAAGMALVDAAIPMYDLITSCTLAVHNQDLFLDPTDEEETVCLNDQTEGNHGVITVSVLCQIETMQVTDVMLIGAIDGECVATAMELLVKSCKDQVTENQHCITSKYVKCLEESDKLSQLEKEREKEMEKMVEEFKKKMVDEAKFG